MKTKDHHPAFKRVALMARSKHKKMASTLIAIKNYLEKASTKRAIILEQGTADILSSSIGMPIIAENQLNQHADVLIVIGGDGSLLHAAHIAVKQNLPVLGVNRGRLGFLTDIPPNRLDKIEEVLTGQYQKEHRFLIKGQLYDNHHQLLTQGWALNDIVLLRSGLVQLIEFDMHIDHSFVCHQRADGFIVATPTGSTAYALSGGGPIVDPRLDGLVLVPMFAHTLSSRPIVTPSHSDICFRFAKQSASIGISFDGQKPYFTPTAGEVHILKKKQNLCLIHPKDYNYFQTLRYKLNWKH